MNLEQRHPDSKLSGSAYPRIRYARGFAIALCNPGAPDHWVQTDLGKYSVWLDPVVPSALRRHSKGGFVFLAGEVLDCANSSVDIAWIADRAAAALDRSEADLYRYFYYMGGRYLLAYEVDGAVRIRADAVGTRSIFYSNRRPGIAASHAALVAAATGARKLVPDFTRRPEFKKGIRHFPGRMTPYEGVLFLTPNLFLDLDTAQVTRYFPREDLPSRNCEEAAALAADGMTKIIDLATQNRTVVQSLTAGLDSRVTLACSRPSKDRITYFTFSRQSTPSQQLDAEVASEMANSLGLKHVVIDRDEVEARVSAEEVAELRWNTFLGNANRLALSYRDTLPGATLHIRSNVGETARARFVQLYGDPDRVDPRFLARIWKTGMVDDQQVQRIFDEFLRSVHFDHIRNYRPLDMFHWEHRTAVWHSMVLNETDVAFSTISAYNAHFILDYMFSAPMKDRTSRRLFDSIVQSAWPHLSKWPINKRASRVAEQSARQSHLEPQTSIAWKIKQWFAGLRHR